MGNYSFLGKVCQRRSVGGLLEDINWVYGFTLTQGVWGAGPSTAGGRNKKLDLQNALERIRKA